VREREASSYRDEPPDGVPLTILGDLEADDTLVPGRTFEGRPGVRRSREANLERPLSATPIDETGAFVVPQ
jgi:hypothetical protein